MPKIVAALEAAERLAAFDPMDCTDNVEETCVICGEIIGVWRGERDSQGEKVYVPVPHSPDCRWQALVAALAPEVVPQKEQKP
jgi:fructose-1,6-bisphosphatase